MLHNDTWQSNECCYSLVNTCITIVLFFLFAIYLIIYAFSIRKKKEIN